MTKVGQIMKEKYDKFMEDMNLREEAWAYEKAEFDKMAHYVDGEAKGRAEGKVEGRAEGKAEGRAEGRAEGIEEGLNKGLAKGHKEGVKESARNLKKLGVAIEVISQATGLSKEEIEIL
jgi:flagellar biosynthesis/type III secretory pathway protein FliH